MEPFGVLKRFEMHEFTEGTHYGWASQDIFDCHMGDITRWHCTCLAFKFRSDQLDFLRGCGSLWFRCWNSSGIALG